MAPEAAIEAVKAATALRVATSTTTQPTPAEWRINRVERKPITPPPVDPLIAYGRQFRPDAAFHQPVVLAPLPLFEFARSVDVEERAIVDRALEVLVRHVRRS